MSILAGTGDSWWRLWLVRPLSDLPASLVKVRYLRRADELDSARNCLPFWGVVTAPQRPLQASLTVLHYCPTAAAGGPLDFSRPECRRLCQPHPPRRGKTNHPPPGLTSLSERWQTP